MKVLNQRPDKSDKGTRLPFFLSRRFCEAVTGYLQTFIDKEKVGGYRTVDIFRQNLNYAKDSIVCDNDIERNNLIFGKLIER